MSTIDFSTRFKKDLKHYLNQPTKLDKLYKVIELLKQDKPLPSNLKPHLLQGEYKDHMECHIENDFLLIWFDKEKGIVRLARLGSHSELFK